MTITQTITSIAPAANPATMDRATFSTAAAANVLGIVNMTTELNTWAGQVNALSLYSSNGGTMQNPTITGTVTGTGTTWNLGVVNATTLNTTGNATFGNAITNSHTVNGVLSVGGAASGASLSVFSATAGVERLLVTPTITTGVNFQSYNTSATELGYVFKGLASTYATLNSTGLAVTGSISATTTILSSGATSGIGYTTGAGGTVTQATNRTTGVTINKVNGAITLVSAAGTATWQTFTVTNSVVAATDKIVVNQKSGTDLNMIHVTNVAAGSFKISFATTGGTTTEQPIFSFAVIKGVEA